MIKMFVMDVDGTLTDGKIYIGSTGEIFKTFNVKDGYGIKKLLEAGVIPVIITGRSSDIVSIRCKELGIEEVYQGVTDKLQKLKEIKEEYSIKEAEIAYIGDDENDLECIRFCGVTGCPRDAVKCIKEESDFIATCSGGEGAVREFVDWILKES